MSRGDVDPACEHGETGICLECPVLMEEAREESDFSIVAKVLGIPLGVLLLCLLVVALL